MHVQLMQVKHDSTKGLIPILNILRIDIGYMCGVKSGVFRGQMKSGSMFQRCYIV